MKKLLLFSFFACSALLLQAQTVSTLAGSGVGGNTNGTGTGASFNTPRGVRVDGSGNVFIADIENHQIKKITTAGVVTTYAGSGVSGGQDGSAANAQFSRPQSMCLDAAGNMYVTEFNGCRVRKISSAGVVSTVAGSGTCGSVDSTGVNAQFNGPIGIAVDNVGNLFVTDYNSGNIRKITTAGVVTTFATGFSYPHGIAIDASNNLYVANRTGYNIKKITPAGLVSTYAGSGTVGELDGQDTVAQFNQPMDVDVDAAGNVYVVCASGTVKKISTTRMVTTITGLAGNGYVDGLADSAKFNFPTGVAAGLNGEVIITDYSNYVVRKYSPAPTATQLLASASFSMQLYPNPASQFITLSLDKVANDCRAELYSSTGQLLQSMQVQQSQTPIDLSGLPQGMYLLRIWADNVQQIEKIIKE